MMDSIETNALVLPSSITVSQNGQPAPEEEGFTFHVSDEKQTAMTEQYKRTVSRNDS
jgi:hypothetical protein